MDHEPLKVNSHGTSWCAIGKNPPANAGDTGSNPDPARLHTSQGSYARVPQTLSPRAWSLCLQREKPPQREAHTPQRTAALAPSN